MNSDQRGLLYLVLLSSFYACVVSVCPVTWTEYKGNCYFFTVQQYRFNDALVVCTSRNATITVFHNDTDWEWFKDQIHRGSRTWLWTGVRLVNRTWTWIDGYAYNKSEIPWHGNKEGKIDPRNACTATLTYKPNLGSFYPKNCMQGALVSCEKPNDAYELCNSEDGWELIDGKCYKLFQQKSNWYDARSVCLSENSDLYFPTSYRLLQSVGDQFRCRTPDEQAWIGVSDTTWPGKFVTTSNATFRYQPFYSYGKVIIQKGATCVYSNPLANFYWESDLCTSERKFLCEKTAGACLPGWNNYIDNCYQVIDRSSSKSTWFLAKKFCEGENAELLMLQDASEEQYIQSLLNGLHIQSAWLGFSDVNQADVLKWMDNRLVSSNYTNWYVGYPKPVANQTDCGKMQIGSSRTAWSNGYCFNSLPFVCKAKVITKLNKTTPAPVTTHCDPGWLQFNSNCYLFGVSGNSSGYSWIDARHLCWQLDADLTTVRDAYEQSFITENQLDISTAWIGLKYNTEYKKLMWIDQTFAENRFQNFFPGEPDDIGNGQQCIKIVGGRQDYTGAWDDANCTSQLDYICRKTAKPGGPSTTPVTATTGATSSRCGVNWIFDSLNGNCYQVVLGKPKTWADALWDCQQNGASLLSISGPREQNFVQAILNTAQYALIQSDFWIGASDASQEGGWEWIDNIPFAYLNWHTGEPNEFQNGGPGEDCAEMVSGWKYQWNDKRCDHEQQYICKKQADPAPTSPGPPTQVTPESCVPEPMISGNYSILDSSQFSASSTLDTEHQAINSRIHLGNTGGWAAAHNVIGEYIQVEFYNAIIMKAVVTMGRSDGGDWVTNYKLQYKYDSFSEWTWYEEPPGQIKIFTGNTDISTPVTNNVSFPIEARGLRLYPTKWHNHISLRWEILGCLEELCKPEYAVSGPLIVQDASITVSSMSDSRHNGGAARLNTINPRVHPPGWEPKVDNSDQWIQVDLGKSMIIRGVTTMGSATKQEWTTSYQVMYRTATVERYYQEPFGKTKIIAGNTNNNETVTYMFKAQFQAQYVKIQPVSYHGSFALRFDILVCQHGCNPEAMIDGANKLSDDALNASSSYNSHLGPDRSRLNQPSQGPYGGSWAPRVKNLHQYIQASFAASVQVVAIATQGRQDAGQWVTQYKLTYSQDGFKWYPYDAYSGKTVVFPGNFDQNTVRKHYLSFPFVAKHIRLWPVTYRGWMSLRWEIYACPGPNSGLQIGCYADNVHNRDLPFEPYVDPSVGLWPPMCVHHCFNKGYYYAGLQNQYKCFCGNSYGRYGPSSDCNLSCYPLTQFKCGGSSSNMIYSTGLTARNKVCRPTWKDYGDHCYLLLLDKQTWFDARGNCQKLGADLVTLNSQAEQDLVYSVISNGGGQDVWIGLNDQTEENLFEWIRGERVKFTNWNVNQPRQPLNSEEDCVMVNSKTGGWQDENCNSMHQYVCQADKQSTNGPVTPQPIPGCEKGWDGYRSSCYIYIDMPRSFQAAQKVCRDNGATLVQIGDKYEQSYLSSVLGQKNAMYWTDVTDIKSPGTFRYYDSNYPYLVYANWGSGRPTAGTRKCVAMKSGSQAGLWFDIMCNMTSGAVCEKTRIGYHNPTYPPVTTPTVPCNSGWIGVGDSCYQINKVAHNKLLQYDEARKDCTNQGADLASFHSSQDFDTIWRGSLIGSTDNFWIGLDDRTMVSSGRVYKWTDHSRLNFQNWNDNEPNNFHGSEDCAEVVASTGKWNDVNCYWRRNWICKHTRGVTLHPRTTLPYPPSGPSQICGQDLSWVALNNHCYYISGGAGDQAMSWRQARQFCNSHRADLVSITTVSEQFFLQHQILNVTAVALWTGFSETDFGIGYKWSDGSPPSYVNWNTGEPNDFFGAEDCVQINVYNGKWNDAHCANKNGFICEKVPGTKPVTTASPLINGNCPAGFYGHRNKCYKLFTQPMSWDNATKICRSLGFTKFYLASINNVYENAFVTTMLSGMNVNPWIGLKITPKGEFLWQDNSDITYTNWEQGEPNGGKGVQMCTRIYSKQHNAGLWDDYGCDNANAFICETMKSTAITTPEPVPNPCDKRQGFVPFGNDCFLYVSNASNWTTADQYCRSIGSYLTTIANGFEQAYLFLMINHPKVKVNGPVWIGLNDLKSNNTYTWTNTIWPVVYSNWKQGEPTRQPGENCVAADLSGGWMDNLCNQSLPFVCKITTDTPPVSPPPPNGQCPSADWVLNGSKCYLFRPKDYKTFIDATLECHRMEANLVSIHNSTENKFLLDTLHSYTIQTRSFWSGFHKSTHTGFQWYDRSPVNYLNWAKGQPSGRSQRGNAEDCVEVYSWDGTWNDLDCSYQRGYVCERSEMTDSHVNTIPMVPVATTRYPSPAINTHVPPLHTTNRPSGRPVKPTTNGPVIIHTPAPGTTRGPSGTTKGPQGSTKPSPTLPHVTAPQGYTGKPHQQPQQGQAPKKSNLSSGALAGILVGAVVFVAVVMAIAIIIKRRRQQVPGKPMSFENTTYKYSSENEHGQFVSEPSGAINGGFDQRMDSDT